MSTATTTSDLLDCFISMENPWAEWVSKNGAADAEADGARCLNLISPGRQTA